jgi:hypothetical protein
MVIIPVLHLGGSEFEFRRDAQKEEEMSAEQHKDGISEQIDGPNTWK